MASTSLLEELAPFVEQLPIDYEALNQTEGPLSSALNSSTPVSPATPVTPVTTAFTMNDYNFRGPTFPLTGFFTGDGDEPAERWFRRFDVEVLGYANADGNVPPAKYIRALLILLRGTAATWVEGHPETSAIIKKRTPTDDDVEILVNLLSERFPANTADTAPIPLSTELSNLSQKDSESLASYYQRTTNIMSRFGAKDRPLPGTGVSFSQVDSFTLDSVIQAFVKGIGDAYIRKKVYKNWQDDFSLRNVYNLAEQARRSKAEVAKRINEEARDAELHQLRSFIQHLPPSQVERVKSALATNPGNLPDWLQQTPGRSEAPPQRQQLSLPPSPAHTSSHTPAEPRQTQEQQPSTYAPAAGRRPLRDGPSYGNRRNPARPEPRELPEAIKSKNPYINGTLVWSIDKDGVLCVRCGEVGHIGRSCTSLPLPAWEQSYLRNLVFGDPPQVNFAIAGYGAYDGATKPYGSDLVKDNSGWKPYNDSKPTSPTPVPGILTPTTSVSSRSVGYGFSGLKLNSEVPATETKAVEAFYGEGSGPNKRPHVEEIPEPVQNQQPPQPPQQPTQAVPGPVPFQTATDTVPQPPKKKGQRRVGKRVGPMPLVGQMDDFGSFNGPISIRQVLTDNKVNMSFMDLMVWSPAACRELKRLCTRVTKKKNKKGKEPEQQPGQQTQAPQQVPQQAQMPTFAFNPLNPLAGHQQNMPQFAFNQPLQGVPYPTFFQAPGQQPAPVPPQVPPHPQPTGPNTQQSQGTVATVNVKSVGTGDGDAHTRFLSTMVGMEKAFRIPCTIRVAEKEIVLDKSHTQADQGSDMNVISIAMVRRLGLQMHDLSAIGFYGLTMQTADHNETVLQHWVQIDVGVEGLWRQIRAFVGPDGTPGRERLSLLLGLPWLYSVNAWIHIRGSQILIGDASVGETVRAVTGPELVFHPEHNLLLYPKQALLSTVPKFTATVDDEADDALSSSSDESSEDELSDIEQQAFR